MAPYVVFRCLNCKRILKSVNSLENHEKNTHGILQMTHEDYELVWLEPNQPKVTIAAEISNISSEAPVGVYRGGDAGDQRDDGADGVWADIATLDLPHSGLMYLPGPSKGLHSLQPPQQPPPTPGQIQHRNEISKDFAADGVQGGAGSSMVMPGFAPTEADPSLPAQTIRKKGKFKAPLRLNHNSEKICEVSPDQPPIGNVSAKVPATGVNIAAGEVKAAGKRKKVNKTGLSEGAVKAPEKRKKVNKKDSTKTASKPPKPPSFAYFEGYKTGGVSVEGLSMWATSASKQAAKLARSLTVLPEAAKIPDSMNVTATNSGDIINASKQQNQPSKVATENMLPSVVSSCKEPMLVAGQDNQQFPGAVMYSATQLPADQTSQLAKFSEQVSQSVADSMVRESFIQESASQAEKCASVTAELNPGALMALEGSFPPKPQVVRRPRSNLKCEDSNCRPCSISKNCNRCFYCVNRARLKQKCKERQCGKLNPKLMKRPLVPEPDLVEVLEVLVEQPLGLTEINLEEDDGSPAPDDNQGSEKLEEFVKEILIEIISEIGKPPQPILFHDAKLYRPQDKIYKCGKCQKSFSQFKSFRKHKQICDGSITVKFFVCEVCKHSLSSKKSLKRHKKTVHNKKSKPLIALHCEDCDVSFSTKNTLKVHLANKHGKVQVVSAKESDYTKCSVESCNFKHLKSSFVKAHLTRVHGTSKKSKCSICPFQCFSSSGMTKHLQSVHIVATNEEIEDEPEVVEELDKALSAETDIGTETSGFENMDLVDMLMTAGTREANDLRNELFEISKDGFNDLESVDVGFSSEADGTRDESFSVGPGVNDLERERILRFEEL